MSTRNRLRAFLALLFFAVAAAPASAQFEFIPYTSDRGMGQAAEYAAAELPPDARLVLIGAVGEVLANGQPMHIDPENGEASVWAYTYWVGSLSRWRTLAVVNLEGVGMSVFEMDPPVPIPPMMIGTLHTNGAHSTSGAMAAALAADERFAAFYRSTSQHPSVVALRPVGGLDSALLPEGFPLDSPVWSLSFGSGARPTLECWVSSSTGAVHVREQQSSSVNAPAGGSDSGDLRVTSTGSGFIVDVLRPSVGEPAIRLYDAYGRAAPHVVDVVKTATGWRAIVDSRPLPAGAYFLLVGNGGWLRAARLRLLGN